MALLFEHYSVQLWTPEMGGRIDFGAEDHEETMLALGLQSKREIARTKIRVRTVMATQTRDSQGTRAGRRPGPGDDSSCPRTRSRSLGLAGDHRTAFSIVLAGNQIA